jgi:hypothetical protein
MLKIVLVWLVQGRAYMQAPMKLPYVLAFALQIQLARQMMLDAMITGRLPYRELIGTLDDVNAKVR